jgi:hypothetical protein
MRDVLVVDGPDKPGLQWAVAYPERNLRVHFNTDDDIFDASVLEMEELGDGLSFRLTGAIETGVMRGRPFQGVYSVGSRTGVLRVEDAHSS